MQLDSSALIGFRLKGGVCNISNNAISNPKHIHTHTLSITQRSGKRSNEALAAIGMLTAKRVGRGMADWAGLAWLTDWLIDWPIGGSKTFFAFSKSCGVQKNQKETVSEERDRERDNKQQSCNKQCLNIWIFSNILKPNNLNNLKTKYSAKGAPNSKYIHIYILWGERDSGRFWKLLFAYWISVELVAKGARSILQLLSKTFSRLIVL